MFPTLGADWPADLFRTENFMFLCIFGAGAVIAIAAIVSGAWISVERSRRNTALKRDLVARGYSADEIERIVAAKSGSDKQ